MIHKIEGCIFACDNDFVKLLCRITVNNKFKFDKNAEKKFRSIEKSYYKEIFLGEIGMGFSMNSEFVLNIKVPLYDIKNAELLKILLKGFSVGFSGDVCVNHDNIDNSGSKKTFISLQDITCWDDTKLSTKKKIKKELRFMEKEFNSRAVAKEVDCSCSYCLKVKKIICSDSGLNKPGKLFMAVVDIFGLDMYNSSRDFIEDFVAKKLFDY